MSMKKKNFDSGGIRTHASEETGALIQRLRPLGHATVINLSKYNKHSVLSCIKQSIFSKYLFTKKR